MPSTEGYRSPYLSEYKSRAPKNNNDGLVSLVNEYGTITTYTNS